MNKPLPAGTRGALHPSINRLQCRHRRTRNPDLTRGNLRLSRIDSNQRPALSCRLLGGHPHGWNRRARPHLHHDESRPRMLGEPPHQTSFLSRGPMTDPTPVAEHQDVRARDLTTGRASWQRLRRFERLQVDGDVHVVGAPQALMTGRSALQVVDGSVALGDPVVVEPGALELTIDVGGEDEASSG